MDRVKIKTLSNVRESIKIINGCKQIGGYLIEVLYGKHY